MASSLTQAGFAERHGADVLLTMGIVVFAFGVVTFVTDSKPLGAGLWIAGMVAAAVATRVRELARFELEGRTALGFVARAQVAFRRSEVGAPSPSRSGTSVTRSRARSAALTR